MAQVGGKRIIRGMENTRVASLYKMDELGERDMVIKYFGSVVQGNMNRDELEEVLSNYLQ